MCSFATCHMSPYPNPRHSCRTTLDLDLYPYVDRKELKNVDVEYLLQVCWGFQKRE